MTPAGMTISIPEVGNKHTYTNYNMIPKSKITFNPPAIKTKYIDLEGADGRLDYSEILTGRVTYDNRRGTIEFVVLTPTNYTTVYSQLLTALHGNVVNIVLDDDPLFFYKGRLSVNKWKSKEGASTIAIDYMLDPYKYGISHTGTLPDWLWNDLFNNIIYYGTFDVALTKARNLINPSGDNVTPSFNCSKAVNVSFLGRTYSLPKGYTDDPGFYLRPGDNNMTFTTASTARVNVDYYTEKTL